MTRSYTGACQCGAVRYTLTGEPVAAFVCHCTDCQRQSASAFGMAAWVQDAQLEVTSGVLQEWVRHTPLGKQMVCRFCSVCGSRLFHHVLGSPYLSVKTGSLDDPAQLQPLAHIWTASKQPWVDIPAHVLQFERNPENMDALLHAWQQTHAIHFPLETP